MFKKIPNSTDAGLRHCGDYFVEVDVKKRQVHQAASGTLDRAVKDADYITLLYDVGIPRRQISRQATVDAINAFQSTVQYQDAAKLYLLALEPLQQVQFSGLAFIDEGRAAPRADTLDALLVRVTENPVLAFVDLKVPTLAYAVAAEYKRSAEKADKFFDGEIVDSINERLLRNTIRFFDLYGHSELAKELRAVEQRLPHNINRIGPDGMDATGENIFVDGFCPTYAAPKQSR